MTEEEAQDWIASRFGETAVPRVARFLNLVVEENKQQNLIAPSTVSQLWARHAVDSAQLACFGQSGLWLDIGTGGGFPGLVVALLREEPMLLVEPRRKRAAFLERCASLLGLAHVSVSATRVESLSEIAAVISARAVTSVENLLQISGGCANENTRWLLPRGRSAKSDAERLSERWRGMFHVKQSATDPEAGILLLENVRAG